MKNRFMPVLSLLLATVLASSSSGCALLSKPAETKLTETVAPATEEPTTEPETENPAVSYFKGIWQGSDSNVTTIVIKEDGTLFYREINSAKIPTVHGMDGTWTATDTKTIKMSVPGLGAGYELEGTVEGDGVLVKCTNGQPWSDEIIRKSNISLEKIEEIAKNRITELNAIHPADGWYNFVAQYDGTVIGSATTSWDPVNQVFEVTLNNGTYIRVTEEKIITTCGLYQYGLVYPAGELKVIPCAPAFWVEVPVFDSTPTPYYPFSEWGATLDAACKANGAVVLGFTANVQGGVVTNYQFMP